MTMGRMKIYISGQMTGIANSNAEAFDGAAAYWESLGHEVVNPAQHDRDIGIDLATGPDECLKQQLMRWDVTEIASSDSIAFLNNWQESPGARVEYAVAEACGLMMFRQVWRRHDDWLPMWPEMKIEWKLGDPAA